MWSYLEPLFIHSEEVKKELPLDTKRFEKIDGEVKATLLELWKVKKVRQILRSMLLLPVVKEYANSWVIEVTSIYTIE